MREPLFHIVRRNSSSRMRGWAVRGIAILAAVLLSGLLTFLVTGLNPLEVYSKMIQGNFGSTRRIWVLLQNTAILLIIALALTPAFKMRFWNTGAEGQVLIGGFGAAVTEVVCGTVPVPVLRVGVEDKFGKSGPAVEMLHIYGLDADNIVAKAKAAIALKK